MGAMTTFSCSPPPICGEMLMEFLFDFADFCMNNGVEARLQAELQQRGIDAQVVLQQGILEILTR